MSICLLSDAQVFPYPSCWSCCNSFKKHINIRKLFSKISARWLYPSYFYIIFYVLGIFFFHSHLFILHFLISSMIYFFLCFIYLSNPFDEFYNIFPNLNRIKKISLSIKILPCSQFINWLLTYNIIKHTHLETCGKEKLSEYLSDNCWMWSRIDSISSSCDIKGHYYSTGDDYSLNESMARSSENILPVTESTV